jgi:hypothetical protein
VGLKKLVLLGMDHSLELLIFSIPNPRKTTEENG